MESDDGLLSTCGQSQSSKGVAMEKVNGDK